MSVGLARTASDVSESRVKVSEARAHSTQLAVSNSSTMSMRAVSEASRVDHRARCSEQADGNSQNTRAPTRQRRRALSKVFALAAAGGRPLTAAAVRARTRETSRRVRANLRHGGGGGGGGGDGNGGGDSDAALVEHVDDGAKRTRARRSSPRCSRGRRRRRRPSAARSSERAACCQRASHVTFSCRVLACACARVNKRVAVAVAARRRRCVR